MVNRRTRLNGKNIDIDYCFLSDVGCGLFSEDSFSTDKRNKRYLNGKSYKDPDSDSLLLYKYHAFLWERLYSNNDKQCVRKKCNWNEIKYTYKNHTHYLTSDYIGISIPWAKSEGIPDSVLNDYLMIGRSIGGHTLFWRHSEDRYDYWCSNGDDYIVVLKENGQPTDYKKITINTSRGGSNGIYDRFDWTLIMLSSYYECIYENSFENRKRIFVKSNKISELLQYTDLSEKELKTKFNPKKTVDNIFFAFENSRKWLLTFKSFCDFIDFFKLNPFIAKDNNIVVLNPLFPVFPKDYLMYIENSKEIIEERNELIKISL